MRRIVSYILMVSLLLTFSACKTVEDAPLASKSDAGNNEVKTKKSSGKFILKDKIAPALSLGGVDFYIKALGCCNGDYSNPAFIIGNAAINGTITDSATSSFSWGGVSFPAGSKITISNVSGSIEGAGIPKKITVDESNHTKTVTVGVYVIYTITATGGGKTAVDTRNMTIPLSATITK